MVNYLVFFEVNLYHQYYEGSFSKDYDIVVTQELKLLLNNYQLLYKKTSSGFLILCKEDKISLISKSKEAIKFRFGIAIKNSYFENFSKLLPDQTNAKYIFRNDEFQASAVIKENVKSVNLHSRNFVDQNNHSPFLTPSVKLNKIGSNLLIKEKKSDLVIFDGDIYKNIAAQLFRDNYGAYRLIVKDTDEELDVFYAEEDLAKTWAIIEISLESSEDTSFDKVLGSTYKIRIDSRKVYWTYYFVSSSEKVHENILLFSGKQQLNFSLPEKKILQNGMVASMVTSNDPIKLEKYYKGPKIYTELEDLSTEGPKGASYKNKITLPTPDITRIKAIAEKGGTRYYSEIYINNI